MTNNKPEKFFYDHAGWSYNPATETPEEGRTRGAVSLAAAEAWARAQGLWFKWIRNYWDEWDGAEPYDGPIWDCVALNEDGEPVASLAMIAMENIDSDPYRRVVEAELAEEARF